MGTVKINKCKAENCGNFPIMSGDGYCATHLSEENKEKLLTRKQEYIKKRNRQSALARRLHLAQKNANTSAFKPNTIQKPTIPVNSKKRLAELKIYKLLKKDFLMDHPICQCGMPECRKEKSVDIHHTQMGRDRSRSFLIVETWKAVSRRCHRRIHDDLTTAQMVELELRGFL